jgi:hypothetical protein
MLTGKVALLASILTDGEGHEPSVTLRHNFGSLVLILHLVLLGIVNRAPLRTLLHIHVELGCDKAVALLCVLIVGAPLSHGNGTLQQQRAAHVEAGIQTGLRHPEEQACSAVGVCDRKGDLPHVLKKEQDVSSGASKRVKGS